MRPRRLSQTNLVKPNESDQTSHDHQLNWWHDIDPIRVIYQPRLKTHEDLPIAFHSQAAAKAALFLASEILFPRKRIIVFFH